MDNTTRTSGAHHIGLTVPDVAATSQFFIDVLGFRKVGEKPDYPAIFVSDGAIMLTLWQARDPSTAVAFDRANCIGLHHLALKVADADALNAVHDRVCSAADTEIEFAPEPLGSAGTRHLMCYVPGGIRLELIAPV